MKPAVKTLFALCMAHAVLECFAGFWPIYKHLAGLNLQTAAWITTFAGVTASLLQPAFGLWSERGIARGMVLSGVALTMVLAFAGPLGNLLPMVADPTGSSAAAGAAHALVKSTTTYLLLALLLLISRLGHAMFHPPSATLAHQALSDRRTYGLGLFVALGWLGVGLSQTSFSLAFLHTGGHSEVLLIPGLLLLAWMAWWLPPGKKIEHSRQPFREKLAELGQIKRAVAALFGINLMLSLSASALFFVFPELIASKGCAPNLVNGNALILWMIGTAVGVGLGGWAGHRHHSSRLLVLSLFVNFVAYEAFLRFNVRSDLAVAGACLGCGLLTGLCQPLPLARGQTIAPRQAQIIGGVLMGWTWALGNFGQTITAALIKHANMTTAEALGYVGLTNLAAVAFALFLPAAAPEEVSPTNVPVPPSAAPPLTPEA